MGLPVLWWWQWVVCWWMGLCCGFGFREGGGGVDLVAVRVVAGVVVVVVADVAVSCWVGFGRGWVRG